MKFYLSTLSLAFTAVALPMEDSTFDHSLDKRVLQDCYGTALIGGAFFRYQADAVQLLDEVIYNTWAQQLVVPAGIESTARFGNACIHVINPKCDTDYVVALRDIHTQNSNIYDICDKSKGWATLDGTALITRLEPCSESGPSHECEA